MPAQVIGLADAGRAGERVGGKAAVLGELAAKGWPVPPGFVVTADALTEPGLARVLAVAAARCSLSWGYCARSPHPTANAAPRRRSGVPG